MASSISEKDVIDSISQDYDTSERPEEKHLTKFEKFEESFKKFFIITVLAVLGVFLLALIGLFGYALQVIITESPNLSISLGTSLTQVDTHFATSSIPLENRTALECFQVASPVLHPEAPSPQLTVTNNDGGVDGSDAADPPCSVLLMEHVFGFSYGAPFVGDYTPPSCSFNRVVMNFTVVSEGRQFDRIALMYFGDTEVWRTSTAEPTQHPGIQWSFLKDMTEYMYFWKSPQKLIFDLGNLIDDKYTGSFNATLTATFFEVHTETNETPPADLIIPISARKGPTNGASHFTLPAEIAKDTIRLPQNINRAIFSISANGQAFEEFWWANVLQSDVLSFGKTGGQLLGLSPFREVQLFIDDTLVGVQWPFPIIFTGGVVPSLHRPIVGLQAFDLREHEIDITPWLPILCNGAEHTFKIKVAGIDDSVNSTEATLTETVNDSWYVTGKIFSWLDEEGSVTTGTVPEVLLTGPTISLSHRVTQNTSGFNETLTYNIVVERAISIGSKINSQANVGNSSWSQILSYSNEAVVSHYGYNQINNFAIAGTDISIGPVSSFTSVYTYPLYCNQTYSLSRQGNLTINANLIQGLELQVEGSSVFPTGLEAFRNASSTDEAPYITSHLVTSRDGTAFFALSADRKSSIGYGTTNQVFNFGGSREGVRRGSIDELYFRNVTATNGSIVFDSERLEGKETYAFSQEASSDLATDESLTQFAPVPLRWLGLKAVVDDDTNLDGIHTEPSTQVVISQN
ncbi:hypothetical protein M426DRAFT_323466 [Hypoxylon sp. CI-4A]|nr:hypothetical protein M426DRAFT_323466 [Hypoxylon sp. CI-4A]